METNARTVAGCRVFTAVLLFFNNQLLFEGVSAKCNLSNFLLKSSCNDTR